LIWYHPHPPGLNSPPHFWLLACAAGILRAGDAHDLALAPKARGWENSWKRWGMCGATCHHTIQSFENWAWNAVTGLTSSGTYRFKVSCCVLRGIWWPFQLDCWPVPGSMPSKPTSQV
jgi:hypothetical protein